MAAAEPASWAEAMKQYEQEKRAYQAPAEPVVRYHRTTEIALGDYRHKDYPAPVVKKPVQAHHADRFSRHGYGGAHKDSYVQNTVLQQWQDPAKEAQQKAQDKADLSRTDRKPVPGAGPGSGANRPPPVGEFNPHGRAHLFDHLKYSPGPAETEDSWMGSDVACAAKGKLAGAGAFPPLTAAKGRTDLFDVLNHNGPRKLGDDSYDAWLGQEHYNPVIGRQCPVPPFMTDGRRDLYDTIQQSGKPRFNDNGADSWIGNRLIDPLMGKSAVGGARGVEDHRSNMTGIIKHTIHDNNNTDKLESKSQPVGVLVSTAGPGIGKRVFSEETRDINQFKKTMEQRAPDGYLWETDVRGRGREHLHTGTLHAKNVVGRPDLFGTLAQNPATKKEDPMVSKRMVYPLPGTTGHDSLGKGNTMLHWPGA
mmetsp:Transcript_23851/g.28818  ORF Transcript_23851/g.28818 Transcript_23851/m.28818 type:complete len:421 (+) Transcript_23851:122-1384(+)|eukprot:CAMPEP_0197848798 /NCGR_PEP_ID=MMETSP1438-20131217/10088_1 /TAXON_ID=1461541 /ORGANISM="Pterosperma sp., Strain CCMP1384" /LENGTH=420 /DNA_ID=CAMNT_0043461215 /DNA_START=122 /DNA_END=1384 /DNA_ORIENTATION=-